MNSKSAKMISLDCKLKNSTARKFILDCVQCTVWIRIIKLGLLRTRGCNFCVHISLHKNIRWRWRSFAFNVQRSLSIEQWSFSSLFNAHEAVLVHRTYLNSTFNNCLRCHIKMLIYVSLFSYAVKYSQKHENRVKHTTTSTEFFIFHSNSL